MNEEFHIAVLSPTGPRAVGERSEPSPQLKGERNRKRITPGPCGFTPFFLIGKKNMADNVLDSGAPSAKRPKLSSPALSVSASDGNGKYLNAFLILTYIK